MTDHEQLIREAVAAEAAEAVDSRTVLASLRRRRRRPFALVAATTLTAVAAAVAVTVPLLAGRDTAPVQLATPPTAQNVLLIGLDESANADSVVLTHLAADGTVSAVSLPRDAYVDIPGHGMGKLNSAYRATGGEEGGQVLTRTVEALTGRRVDHYATVEMSALGRLADAVGGIEVCARLVTDDGRSAYIQSGDPQLLNGEQALDYVRQRYGLPNGDLDRVLRQQEVLRAVGAKVLDRSLLDDPARVAALVDVVRANVGTDPDWDLYGFARSLTPGASVRTGTIPVGASTDVPGVGSVLPVDQAAVRAFLDTFTAGATGTDTPGTAGRCVN